MRLLLLALLIASCSNPVAQEDRDPGVPDVPFDSIAPNCQPVDSASSGQVQVICTAVFARPITH